MPYHLHLNLQQRATIKTATSFWEKQEVKDKAAEFLKYCEKFQIYEVRKGWVEFTKTVVDEWNKNVLPKQLEAEVIHVVKMVGEEILNWYRYIKFEYVAKEEAINCFDKIKWTSYGTVDVVKIFESSWLNNLYLRPIIVYIFACLYAMEDYINDLWDKIPRYIQNDCNENSYKYFNQHILVYWKHCRNNDLPNLMRYLRVAANNFNRQDMQVFNIVYDLSRSTEENMLRLSVHQGYFIATKYFWDKLTREERDESVLKSARIAVWSYRDCKFHHNNNIRDYKISQYVEICIFLMNQMSEGHKKSFLNEKLGLDNFYYYSNKADVKDDILNMLLSTWPWQELFITVLEDMLQHQDDLSAMPCMFLDTIADKMVEDHRLGYSLETNIYRRLLREAWLIMPASIKQKIERDYNVWTFLNNLIYIWDLDSLGLILNDPDIAAVRVKFIDLGFRSYRNLIKTNQFEKLDKFLEEISRSEEEKKWFKQKIDIIYDLGDNYFLINNLLDLQCTTPEERQSTKNIKKYFKFCRNLIRPDDNKLVEKFINWSFDTEEEKKKCKDHFKNDSFSIKYICQIWFESGDDINSAKDKCSRFLHWFLESEEEIALFKKGMSVNLESDRSIINDFIRVERDGMYDVLKSWCLSSDEQFQQIKQAIAQFNVRPD